jgi:hypothetical protein
MARKRLPFEVTVSKPCEESWEAMIGNSRERHCELCDRQVHNFAAMTSRQIEKLVAESGGRLCGRITRRRDGGLVTLDDVVTRSSRASVAAQVIASAALAAAASGLHAQALSDDSGTDRVAMRGIALRHDGKAPQAGVLVKVSTQGTVIRQAQTDENGKFEFVLDPGVYDLEIGTGTDRIGYRSIAVQHRNLELGEVAPVSATVTITIQTESMPLMGEIAEIGPRYTLPYILRHPVKYTKHLMGKS